MTEAPFQALPSSIHLAPFDPDPQHRALLLAPRGRDAAIGASLLREAGIAAEPCADLPGLCEKLEEEVGLAILTEEALRTADLRTLSEWVHAQPSWSDFPFIVLTTRGGGPERNPEAARLSRLLGNVTFLERPFHPTTLVSVAQTALRGRKRQYEARARLEDLAENEERLRTALKAGRLGSWELDLAGWTLSASEASKAHYGRSSDAPFTYAELLKGLHPEDRATARAALERSLRTGADYRLEYRFAWPDGSIHWIDVRAHVLHDHQGRPTRMVGVSSDITERKLAEAERERLLNELETERARFQTAVEKMPVGVALVEPGGRVVLANPAFRECVEGGVLPSLDHERRGSWVAYHPDGSRVASWDFPGARALRNETVLGMEFQHTRPDGRTTWSLVSGIPLLDATSHVSGALVVVVDVAREKQAQEALQRLADTLEQRVAERTAQLASANEDLRNQVAERERAEEQLRQAQKMEAIGQLTGGVAHDFNNLLMAVLANLDLLSKRVSRDPDTARLIEAAQEGARRGAALTQRLLAFARRQDLQRRSLDLGELVLGMKPLFERSVGPLVAMDMNIPQGLPAANVDPNQLELALLNLAVNARDAMPGGGTLSVDLEPHEVQGDRDLAPGTYLRLRIRDTGTGMDAQTLEKSIEPFFTTKEVGKGTGLGLSMVHGLAVQLGGALRLMSRQGEGTTAELWLPAAGAPVDFTIAQPPRQVKRARPAKILLVEDDALIAMSTIDMLEDLGHSVLEANSGARALEILESGTQVDLMMTDHAMPGMTGLELVGEARRLRPDLPMLLVTGYAELLEEGNRELPRLSKPYDQGQLAAQIDALLAVRDG